MHKHADCSIALFTFYSLVVLGTLLCCEAAAQSYPKVSPFSGLRFEENAPVVKVASDWYTLVSIDDVPANQIVAYSKRTYGNRWQKRIGEDLVELMAGMGKQPGDTVRLVVSPVGSSTEQTLERVAMTRANREAIRSGVAKEDSSSEPLSDAWVKKLAEPLIENKIADGISVGYIKGDDWGIVHLGTSNRGVKKPTNGTIYELGSISKVFTGLLLADAVVRNEIELTAKAEVPNQAGIRLPSREGVPISWLDLSTHRSGLPRLPENLSPSSMSNPYRKYDSKQAAEFLSSYELPRKPGESREYSNFAVSVLGYLLAEQAGQPYEKLLQKRIAAPLGLKDCTVKPSKDQRRRLATPHDTYGSPTAFWTFADLPGAGGVRGTMYDMMRFAKAHLSPPKGTIGRAIELAWRQHRAADESGSAMGLGWIIHADGSTRWHNGGTGGSRSSMWINREINAAVVVLCNTSVESEVDLLAMQIIKKAAGHDVELASNKGEVRTGEQPKIDAKLRSRLEGRYELNPNFIFTINDQNGRLMVGITNQPTQEVFPDSATRWSYRSVEAALEFELPTAGPAESLVLVQNGLRQKARRIKPSPDKAVDLAIDEQLRKRLEGRYELNPNFIFTVSDQKGRLMVGITNQPTQEVFPDSATRWSYRRVAATLEFKLPASGPAKSLILHQNGLEQMARRIE